MSVTKAKAFENELASQTSHHEQHDAKDASTCPDYRLIELPRARKVGQSYFSSIGTTLYSMMISLWKLAIEPIVKGRHKQMPDLLIVNGPGTCVVVVLIYRLLRVSGTATAKRSGPHLSCSAHWPAISRDHLCRILCSRYFPFFEWKDIEACRR